MSRFIPTYDLESLSQQKNIEYTECFLLTQRVNSETSFAEPFRSSYYGVGICLNGEAKLNANLESYQVMQNNVVAMAPQVIKQWLHMSDNFETLTIFFTKEFITKNNFINIDSFDFFENVAQHCFSCNDEQTSSILSSLKFIKEKYEAPHFFKNQILKNLINVLLYEILNAYKQQNFISNPLQTRSQLLASEFKKQVIINFSNERSVKYYASVLSITPKHLTETIKEVTGKTAGEIIDEAVILEAKILLQTPNRTIAQIADTLNFSDQSIFGKYFKNITGFSPMSYRKGLL